MSKKHKSISKYEFEDGHLKEFTKFKTLQKNNENQERVFVKNVPSDKLSTPIKIANILDHPQDVNWKKEDKISHLETINPDFQRYNYNSTATTGSFCATSGTFNVLKELNAQVISFPLVSLHPNNPVRKCEFVGNMNSRNSFMGSVDAPTWFGYVTTSGMVTLQAAPFH